MILKKLLYCQRRFQVFREKVVQLLRENPTSGTILGPLSLQNESTPDTLKGKLVQVAKQDTTSLHDRATTGT